MIFEFCHFLTLPLKWKISFVGDDTREVNWSKAEPNVLQNKKLHHSSVSSKVWQKLKIHPSPNFFHHPFMPPTNSSQLKILEKSFRKQERCKVKGQKTLVNDKNLIQFKWTIEWRRREAMLRLHEFRVIGILNCFWFQIRDEATKNDKLKPRSRFAHFECLYVLAIKKFFVGKSWDCWD